MTGKELMETRMDMGLSVKAFAQKAGVSEFAIRNFEAGKNKPRKSTMELICTALGIEYEDAEAPEPEPEPIPESHPLYGGDGITETLTAIQKYGEDRYRKGKEEAIEIFKKAVLEAIARWEDAHEE